MSIVPIQTKNLSTGRNKYKDNEIRCVVYKYKNPQNKPHYEIKFTFGRKCPVATNYNIGADENKRIVFFPDLAGFKVTSQNGENVTHLSAKLQLPVFALLPEEVRARLGLFSKCRVAVTLDKSGNLWIDGIENEPYFKAK